MKGQVPTWTDEWVAKLSRFGVILAIAMSIQKSTTAQATAGQARTSTAVEKAGTEFPDAPSIAPGQIAPVLSDPLREARERYSSGDLNGTVNVLSPWLNARRGPWGNIRIAGHLLMGKAHLELENYNLASTSFYRVRKSDSPLARYGAWYEALADHSRGRHLTAAKECKAYRDRWPNGPHAQECILLIADAYAAQGIRTKSTEAYQRYLSLNPNTPRKEEIELAIALATAKTNPSAGIRQLHSLALHHSYPSTDISVNIALDELAQQGHETQIPSDPSSQIARCTSLRRSGRFEEAWNAFVDIAQNLAPDHPSVAAWVEDNERSFAWGTRRYDLYAQNLTVQYVQKPDAELAWRIFQAWCRAGLWGHASAWAERSRQEHAQHWRWRNARDDHAWATMLAAHYDEAHLLWKELAKSRGKFGRKAQFYSALCAHLASKPKKAEAEFGEVIRRGREWLAAGHYWRSKIRTAQGNVVGAQKDREAVSEHDDTGWYILLLGPPPTGDTFEGRWKGPLPGPTPTWNRPAVKSSTQETVWPQPNENLDPKSVYPKVLEASEPPQIDWKQLAWNQQPLHQTQSNTEQITTAPSTPVETISLPLAGYTLPRGDEASIWYDPENAEKVFSQFVRDNQAIWPTLPIALGLSNAGFFTDASDLVYKVYEEWKANRGANTQGQTRSASISKVSCSSEEWRQMFLYVRDYYHAARVGNSLAKQAQNPTDKAAAKRIAYPIAYGNDVWHLSQKYNVDPFLMLGIMRQESVYRASALSGAGAIGLVQVMPQTGAKVAAMMGDPKYSPQQLLQPATNLRYGVYYFSLLLDRFNGVFPLAVASYNGGPHNMSRFTRQTRNGAEIDALVELILFDESRDYVKKVTGHYANYVDLYASDTSQVLIPTTMRGDDPSIVNF